jgi:hypothetical protein
MVLWQICARSSGAHHQKSYDSVKAGGFANFLPAARCHLAGDNSRQVSIKISSMFPGVCDISLSLEKYSSKVKGKVMSVTFVPSTTANSLVS